MKHRSNTNADFLKALASSPVAKLNQHLLNSSNNSSSSKKLPKQPKSSKALRWIGKNLHIWCREKKHTLRKEYEFAPGRKYRSDWAIEEMKVLIEFEGGVFMARGGHNSPTGIQRDIDKYSLAQKLGFTVIRLTAINYETILQQLDEILKNKGGIK